MKYKKKLVINIVAAACICVSGACCSSREIRELHDDLSDNQAKWQSHNITNYRYDFGKHCFCGGWAAGSSRIFVRGGIIDSVWKKGIDTAVADSLLNRFYTIEDFFSLLEEQIDKKPYEASIEFDATYGFPSTAYFDQIKNAIDDEINYTIDSFAILQ